MIFTKSKKCATNKNEHHHPQLKSKTSLIVKSKNSSEISKCKVHMVKKKFTPKIKHKSLLKENIIACTKHITPKVVCPQQNTTKPVSTSSTCTTTLYNSININQVLVLLKNPINIYGTLKLTLIAGSINVFGYKPELNKQITVYSPGGFSNLKIETREHYDAISKEFLREQLLSFESYYRKSQIAELIEKFDISKDAVLLLERNHRSKIVDNIKKYMSEDVFPNMNVISLDRPFYTSEFLLKTLISTECTSALQVHRLWQNIDIKSNSKIMVIGGKNVGKSTLVRYLINKNIQKLPKILLIDLDIGQPEVFVPQTVSATVIDTPLLGPGFFLKLYPIKSFMVGKTNVVLIPYLYSEAVQKLFEYCRNNEDLSNIPWIINTMGYNKGFGSEVIAMISSSLNPTDIIQIQSNKDANNFEFEMNETNIKNISQNIYTISESYVPNHRLHILKSEHEQEPTTIKEWQLSSKDVRHAIIIERLGSISTRIKEWLTESHPISADLDKLKFICFDDNARNEDDLIYTLNANLVYMCRQETNETPECFGIGIVRGIDFERNLIVIIPAVPEDLISKVNTLAIGDMPLPSVILTNQGPRIKSVKVPYVYSGLDDFGSKFIKQMLNRHHHKV